MKYKVTKRQCQKQIDFLNNVCERCGRKIKPIKTVDNGGSPTYWAGCFHVDNIPKETTWGNFTNGVSKEVYELAVKLVLQDSLDFGMTYDDKTEYPFDYGFENAVSRACSIINEIEWMKNHQPRYTKEDLEKLINSQKTS